MRVMQGKGVSGGIAFGTVKFYDRDELGTDRQRIDNPDDEIRRFKTAKQTAISQLDLLYERALREVGESNAQIFDVHRMLIEDPDLNESVEAVIRSQYVNAEYAVALTSDNLSDMFAAMEDEYMRERSADVRDVANRIMRCLMNRPEEEQRQCGGCIICADDLSPSETVQIDREHVLAFCTAHGSAQSHTAILARTMNIPAVTGLGAEFFDLRDGDEMIVDGSSGILYINPDVKTKKEMLRRRADALRYRERLQGLRGRDNVTLDGHRVSVYANVTDMGDIGAALANDCGGIGLFRSEFLYMESSDYPTEEFQYRTYRRILERMPNKKVIIRTLDIGADKEVEYFNLPKEENPALGYRAIRICLNRPDIFKTQLRALMRASVYGKLGIMFPMIISLDEILETKALLAKVKAELSAENIPYDPDVEIGIMIETPAAVMISDILAKEVDFLSIGANDLTTYTLAVDRLNADVSEMFDTHHKALLRMIKLVTDNAHRNDAWVGICGGLGADTELTEIFLAMGIDGFSVTPQKILPLRDKILSIDLSDGEKVLAKALS